MTAFTRTHAFDTLDNYSYMIAFHCLLTASFPEHDAIDHWNAELDGYAKTLSRFNKGKKNRRNFNRETVREILVAFFNDEDDQQTMEQAIIVKELDTSRMNTRGAIERVDKFLDKLAEFTNI